MASLVEFTLYKDKGLGAMREPSSLCLVGREYLVEEAIEIRCSLVGQRVGLRH